MKRAHLAKVRLQRLQDIFRQHGHPVLAAFAVAHQDLAVGEIHVLHAQRETLRLPQAGAVEKRNHEARAAFDVVEQARHLAFREHHRQAHRALRVHHFAEPGQILP